MSKVHVGLIMLLLGVALIVFAALVGSVETNGRAAIGIMGFILCCAGGACAAENASS
jgi:hypothetical protein